VIHADLFPDNVLLLGDAVTGLIDFYFACNEITAYDLAVTHSAWCFASDGSFKPAIAEALVAGYVARRPLSEASGGRCPVLAAARRCGSSPPGRSTGCTLPPTRW
jgi:homoserine kinase type II